MSRINKITGAFMVDMGGHTEVKQTKLGNKFLGLGLKSDSVGHDVDMVIIGQFCIRDMEGLGVAVGRAVKKISKGRRDATYLIDVFQDVLNEELNKLRDEAREEISHRYRVDPETEFTEDMRACGVSDEQIELMKAAADGAAKMLAKELLGDKYEE